MGLWPLACWDCGFQYGRGHGCLSLVKMLRVFKYRSLRRADPSSREFLQCACVCECVWVCVYVWVCECVCVWVCVCVSARVVKRNNNPLHLHSEGRKDQTKTGRKNYMKYVNTMCGKSDEFINVKGRWYDTASSAAKHWTFPATIQYLVPQSTELFLLRYSIYCRKSFNFSSYDTLSSAARHWTFPATIQYLVPLSTELFLLRYSI